MCGAKTLYISQQSISVHLQQEKLCECRSIVVVRQNSTTVQIRDTMRTDGVKLSIQNCANKRDRNQYKFVHCRLGKGYKKIKCETKLKQVSSRGMASLGFYDKTIAASYVYFVINFLRFLALYF